MENPTRMDDLGGYHYFWKHPIVFIDCEAFANEFGWLLVVDVCFTGSPSFWDLGFHLPPFKQGGIEWGVS